MAPILHHQRVCVCGGPSTTISSGLSLTKMRHDVSSGMELSRSRDANKRPTTTDQTEQHKQQGRRGGIQNPSTYYTHTNKHQKRAFAFPHYSRTSLHSSSHEPQGESPTLYAVQWYRTRVASNNWKQLQGVAGAIKKCRAEFIGRSLILAKNEQSERNA